MSASNNTTRKKSNPKSAKAMRKKRRKRKLIIFIIEIIILLVLLAALYVTGILNKINRQVLDEDELSINDLDAETLENLEGYTTIALFGVDNHDAGEFTGRSDSIIIAVINNDTNEVRLCSVYRDTYLNIGNGSYSKANSAYNAGGATQAIAMLNSNLDLDITDYVTVDFNAMVDIIDIMGGIELTITEEEAAAMNGELTVDGHASENYIATLEETTGKSSSPAVAGTYTCDGIQAVAYCRVRYTSGDDYKRAERQRTVIAKIIEKAKEQDLATLNKMINAVVSEVETSLTNAEILTYAAQVTNYELTETSGFPFFKNTATVNSASCVIPCDLKANVIYLHEFLYDDEDYSPTEDVLTYSAKIVNATGLTADDANDALYASVSTEEEDTEEE